MTHANSVINESLLTLLNELIHGPSTKAAFFLNRGDRGLLASLALLSAADASARAPGCASVAAHVDHLRYGLGLLNRWARGEDPWRDANFAASWQWASLRAALAHEAEAWGQACRERQRWDEAAMTESFASVVHLAYHLGAIRQMSRQAIGPPASADRSGETAGTNE
jgi:hypothetical protein